MRIAALIIRIFQQILRDKRTLALLLFAPLFILTLMYFIFNGNDEKLNLGVSGISDSLAEALKNTDIDITVYEKADSDTVIENKLDGLLIMDDGFFKLTLENSDPTVSKSLQMKINQILSAQLSSQQMQVNQLNLNTAMHLPEVKTDYIYGDKDTSLFDVFSSILIGFFVFFFVFLISGIGLLRERTTGTLEKLMSAPIRKSEVVTGYLMGYGAFAVIQTLVIIFFSIHILNISVAGSIWYVIIINLMSALTALSLGILLSTFASSEFQMVQFIPIVIVPQVFFSGIFPVEGMADWLRAFSKVMPMYYAADALKGVMYMGWGLNEIYRDLLILGLFIVIFIGLNILALKKYRKL